MMGRVKIKRRVAGLLAALLTAAGLVAVTTPRALAACTPAPHIASGENEVTGDNYHGSWSHHFNSDCNGTTVADITVTWNSFVDGHADPYVKYDMTITTGAIYANECVYIALDWNAPGHGDSQIMRNCKENSTFLMGTETHNLNKYSRVFIGAWPLQRLQIGQYDPGDHSIARRICPADVAPLTQRAGGCYEDSDSWKPNPVMSNKAAKIRVKRQDGQEDQNLPLYPGYDVKDIIDPDN